MLICAIFFKDGEEEMMRNASCSINLFHVNNYIFFKEASKSNPLHQNILLRIQRHAKRLT